MPRSPPPSSSSSSSSWKIFFINDDFHPKALLDACKSIILAKGGTLVNDPKKASVIVTALKNTAQIRNYVNLTQLRDTPIVSIDWIHNSPKSLTQDLTKYRINIDISELEEDRKPPGDLVTFNHDNASANPPVATPSTLTSNRSTLFEKWKRIASGRESKSKQSSSKQSSSGQSPASSNEGKDATKRKEKLTVSTTSTSTPKPTTATIETITISDSSPSSSQSSTSPPSAPPSAPPPPPPSSSGLPAKRKYEIIDLTAATASETEIDDTTTTMMEVRNRNASMDVMIEAVDPGPGGPIMKKEKGKEKGEGKQQTAGSDSDLPVKTFKHEPKKLTPQQPKLESDIDIVKRESLKGSRSDPRPTPPRPPPQPKSTSSTSASAVASTLTPSQHATLLELERTLSEPFLP
ncbi:hypothetical protein HK102_007778, partial [Quaeritorhiza haematococci]